MSNQSTIPPITPGQAAFQRDEAMRLTRLGMENIILRGGSVEYKGRVISNVAQLPTVDAMAAEYDSVDQANAAVAANETEIDSLLQEIHQINRDRVQS